MSIMENQANKKSTCKPTGTFEESRIQKEGHAYIQNLPPISNISQTDERSKPTETLENDGCVKKLPVVSTSSDKHDSSMESHAKKDNPGKGLPHNSNKSEARVAKSIISNKLKKDPVKDPAIVTNAPDEHSVIKESRANTEDHGKDLPLMANISDIHITHYILQLKCLMEDKYLAGSIILFKCSDLVPCRKCTKDSPTRYSSETCPCNKKFVQSYSSTLYCSKHHGNAIKEQNLSEYRKETIGNQQKDKLYDKNKSLEKDSKLESEQHFKLVLDCCDITIDNIEELDLPLTCMHSIRRNTTKLHKSTVDNIARSVVSQGPLCWDMDSHSLSIWKKGVHGEKMFPDVIQIHFRTSPKGQSLKWTVDQDSSPCVFTHGHWINNRSMFPSQDAPAAMATWQAEIEVKSELFVVMGGEDNEVTTSMENGWKKEYFHSNLDMPSSTLSLAIGRWVMISVEVGPNAGSKGHQIMRHNNRTLINNVKSCRIIGPIDNVLRAEKEISSYIPLCLTESNRILGPYPFTRVDILIVPQCFDSLGMASPSVIYISQSLLAGDFSMMVRLAHEICHSWFGLLIGPKDWTEEWLTEGFCTYVEDILHFNVKMALETCTLSELIEETELRKYLKFKTLENELKNTNSDLQMLRPNKDVNTESKSDGTQYVKDGMNPDKRFIQVHYLKGYFLLCYLDSYIGRAQFVDMFYPYVMSFHKELVSSKEAISCIFAILPELRNNGLTEEKVMTEWLDQPGMPEPLKNFSISQNNSLLKQVEKQVLNLKRTFPIMGCRKRKRLPPSKIVLDDLSPVQLVLCLEMLLEEDYLSFPLLSTLDSKYNLMAQNADIQHRWCELIVKHKAQQFYKDLKSFLFNHQAMGVYLYGEMIISGCPNQKLLAIECFEALQDHMEPDPYSTVKAMIYGT